MWVYIRTIIKNNNKMNTELIFKGITTSELISYKVAGDNSKELKKVISINISLEDDSDEEKRTLDSIKSINQQSKKIKELIDAKKLELDKLTHKQN